MNRIIAILVIITLLWSNVLIIHADTSKIPQWPFEDNACLVVRKAQNIMVDRKILYDYSNAVMPNRTATAESDDLIYFHLNNYIETNLGVGIRNDISKAEIVITNADKRLYEIKYPADNPRGITINGDTQIKSISSFLEYFIVPANILYGECEAVFTVTRNDENTEMYKFCIDVKAQYLPLDISEIDIREVSHDDGVKIGHIFLKGINGLIGFSDPDGKGEFSVTSINGTECYIASGANLQQLFDNKSAQEKYDSIDIPFHYIGLEHHYHLTIPKGLLLLESGLNEEYTLDFDVNISVSDYILRFSPEDGSTIMMDTESQTEHIFIDIAKPCQIADGMKIFVNGNAVDYEISDENDYYRISFNLNIMAGQHYTISFENNTIVLPNGVTNEKTERFDFDTVLKGSVDVFDVTTFRDLSHDHWAYKFVSELTNKSIISGYDDGTFMPESYVTRGELAKLLSIAFGKTSEQSSYFADVGNHWAEKYIAAMQQVIPLRDGLKSINFYPDEYATREEVAASIALLIDVSQDVIVNSANNATTFLDESEIREDLRANVNFAVYLGIIYGYDGNVFKPHYNITRAEIAAMICRSLEID